MAKELAAKDRPWWGFSEWRDFHRKASNEKTKAHYEYIKGMERIRDLTDSEYWYAEAYDHVILGVANATGVGR